VPKLNEDWTVLPHGELTELAPNLFTVVGKLHMPLGDTPRRMTVVKLSGGGLVVYSAISLDEKEMKKLEALGTPAYLVVPGAIHRLDAKAWKKRYPSILVVAPEGAHAKISEAVAVNANGVDFGDERVRLMPIPGTASREFAMVVDTGSGKTLVLNDLIFNLPKLGGFGGFVMRLLGFGPGEPTIPKLVEKKLVADPEAVRTQLRDWADLGLERLLVSHGPPIENPRRTLLHLADTLS
jgi:hypothetical protein